MLTDRAKEILNIAEGKMPEEAQLQELQRRWDDISGLAETLSANGVAELVSVAFRDASAEAEKEKEKKNTAQQRRNRGGGARNAEAKDVFKPMSHSYVVVFRARPNALVKAINAISGLRQCPRCTRSCSASPWGCH